MDILFHGIVSGSQGLSKLVADPKELTIGRTEERIYKILLIAM